MKHLNTFDNFINEAGKISIDSNQEYVRLKVDTGHLDIGSIWNERGAESGYISIGTKTPPEGYIRVKISDFIDLINKYNKEIAYPENKIKIKE